MHASTSIDTKRTALFRIIRAPVWNSLPSALLYNSCSLNAYYAFWRRLKTYLFRQFKHHPVPLCRFWQRFWHPILNLTRKFTIEKFLFTSLHGMQTRFRDDNSVLLSVCLSNAWIVTKRNKISPDFLYHTKGHLAYSLLRKKTGWWADPSTWKFGSTGPRWSEIANFEPILARSASVCSILYCTFPFVYQKWE